MRRLLGHPGDRQRGVAEAGVALTGAALVLGAALGSGVASTVVTMSDGVTWLPDDQTGQVVQVNPGTGRAERRLQVGEPGSELQVSQRDGRLVVVDGASGTATSIDLATLMAAGQRRTDDPARVLVGGGHVYLVSAATGVVRAVDPLTLKDLGSPYRLDEALADAVVDERGAVWVVTTAGDVRSVSWLADKRRFEVGEPRPVRGAGAGTRLLPHARGVTVFAPDGGAVLQVGVGRDLAVAVPVLSGEVLPASSAPTNLAPAGVPARSAVVMLVGDRLLEVGVGDLGCRRPGRPAVFAGLVHVPCTGAGRVLVLRPDGTRARPDVVIPVGQDPRLLVDDGRLVVSSEDGSQAVLVQADGSTKVIDTGRSGAAVHDPRHGAGAPVAAPPPHRPATQRRGGPPPPGAWQGSPWQGPPTGGPAAGAPVGPGTLPSLPGAGTGADTAPGDDTGADTGPTPTKDEVGAPDRPAPGARPAASARPGAPARPPSGRPADGATADRPGADAGPSATPSPAPTLSRPAVTRVRAAQGEPRGDSVGIQVAWQGVTPAPDWYLVQAVPDRPDPRVPTDDMTLSTRISGDNEWAVNLRVWCGTDYTFTVVTQDGSSVTSPPGSAFLRTVPCEGGEVSSRPRGVTATANADGTVTVSWTPSSESVDEYLVGPLGGATTRTAATATSVVLRDVPPGTDVRFVVSALLDAGPVASEPSNAVTVVGAPSGAGEVSSNRAARGAGYYEFGVVWQEAVDNGSPLLGYDVAWSGGGLSGGFTTTSSYASVRVDCTATALCVDGGPVAVTVTPRNAVGTGPASIYVHEVADYGPREGDDVVASVGAAGGTADGTRVAMVATLAPPESWASHTGGCTLVMAHASGDVTRTIDCDSEYEPLGTFPLDSPDLTVSVRAEGVDGGSVTSAAVRGDIPATGEWSYGRRCTPGVLDPGCIRAMALEHDPEVVVVPLPWSARLPVTPERPLLTASGLGLLLAAAALRSARRGRPGGSLLRVHDGGRTTGSADVPSRPDAHEEDPG